MIWSIKRTATQASIINHPNASSSNSSPAVSPNPNGNASPTPPSRALRPQSSHPSSSTGKSAPAIDSFLAKDQALMSAHLKAGRSSSFTTIAPQRRSPLYSSTGAVPRRSTSYVTARGSNSNTKDGERRATVDGSSDVERLRLAEGSSRLLKTPPIGIEPKVRLS